VVVGQVDIDGLKAQMRRDADDVAVLRVHAEAAAGAAAARAGLEKQVANLEAQARRAAAETDRARRAGAEAESQARRLADEGTSVRMLSSPVSLPHAALMIVGDCRGAVDRLLKLADDAAAAKRAADKDRDALRAQVCRALPTSPLWGILISPFSQHCRSLMPLPRS